LWPQTQTTIKTGHAIALTAAGLLAFNLYSRAQAAGSLTFFPGKIRRLEWDGLNPVIVFELIVQNTSNHAFNINSFAGNVYTIANGHKYLIGYVYNFTTQAITSTSQAILEIRGKLQLAGVVSDLINAFNTGNFAQDISLESFANVDGLQVPVNYTYKLTV